MSRKRPFLTHPATTVGSDWCLEERGVPKSRLEINVSDVACRDELWDDRGVLVGYARVSTHEQTLALQQDALAGAGCERIFTESPRRLPLRRRLAARGSTRLAHNRAGRSEAALAG